MVSLGSLNPGGGEFIPATVQEALTEEPTVSPHLFQASLRSPPSPFLCPSPLPTWWCSAPVFYLRHGGWVSKLQILGTQHGANVRGSFGGGSHQALAGAALSQKGRCMNAQGLGVYG